ncbi:MULTISPECIES: glycerol-3-phosphate 1-O-acyltransferase PlsY [Cytobacillus]|jgi:acyl phosphate:glycerol-3-phosphate acyltransferase|uniref:Glycerol-3-phosphate acyltransferase n=3 Tax=Cytobacillus TaxID=2675230 RepID=A0A160M768_9BACI|nr:MULTISPECIES: glycerol-3-phosphate 1-O-acyltransferase PlsY [Cytobacillus]MBY0156674.1 glycerol-3-phosphate 1-O-acyltransferase PlsY [Cytobacillus firmus]AND38349.1 glycerol-3-phosphate acyltransferase [Cytobacillus oceanisediminis 2691]MBU8730260.1 glycerol-3-phosphate 1-O-acyltransferase PlsY [Cytobacillus oceanisediminis]MCM3242087.1 glycerol-3-phosphate 1-O-acyltransferase PlsY [Cytobacillus oceanisediminis]MCM3391170.1 glycerol-3-phosphate 1-O-acyltransferase PlsY [Cytobacillus oceanis
MLNILTLFLSYLIGSFSFALVIGKLFYKTDIRGYGSGNLGATNVYRVLGKKAGLIVAIADLLKGTFACLLPQILNSAVNPIICGLLAILGHVFPIFAGFKGGKAVATATGVLLFLTPFGTLTGFVVFLLTLILSKYVSLSSMLAGIAIFIYSLIFEDKVIIALSLFISVLVIILHRQNIKRLITGTENKLW